MVKYNSIILSSILCISISNNTHGMENLLPLFDSSKIREQAAANIARQEAEKKAAKIAAEADRIARERAEAIILVAKILGKFVCKTGMFSYKLVTNPPRTLELLINGKSDAWIGCTGLLMSITGLVVLYKHEKTKNKKRLDQEFAEAQRRQREDIARILKARIEAEKKEEEEKKKEEAERRRKEQNQMPKPSAPSDIYYDYEDQPGLYPNIS